MHFILQLADKLARLVLYTFVATVIILAIMTSLLRYYLPQMDQYRIDLLTFLSEQTHWQVDAEQLTGSWQHFRPSFTLHNANLAHSDSGHRVGLSYLQVELNIVKSLYYRKIYLENLALDGLKVVLLQDQYGSWGVAADPDNQKALSLEEVADYIWSIANFSLQRLSLTMVPYQKEVMYFPEVNATLQTWLNQKLFQLDLDEDSENRSRFIVEADNHFRDDNFTVKAYWQLRSFPLHLMLPLINDLQVHEESRISQDMWFQWEDGKPSGVGSFTLDSLSFNYKNERWDAESMLGSFYLETKANREITLGIPSLSVTLNNQHINLDKLKLQLQEHQNTINIAQLDLDELNSYLSLVQLPPRLQELRESLDGKGVVRNIKVQLFDQDMLLQANLDRVSVGAWNGAPALKNVNGYVEASYFSGFVDFYSDDFSMAFPQLYDDSMSFRDAKGKVYWQVADTIKVGSEGVISLRGLYGDALGQFQLEIPKANDGGETQDVGRISLVVDLKDGDVRYRNYLVPSTLNENLLSWLDDSIVKGWVNHGSFIYHGPIVADSHEQKVVELWLDIEDAGIRFHPEFAVIEDINGQFLLDQLVATADINSAKTQRIKLQNTDLHLWFTEKNPKLKVQTQLYRQSAADILGYLQQDFITERSNGVIDEWHIANGIVNASVHVDVPLDRVEQLNVVVKADLEEIKLDLNRLNLSLSAVGGDLLFDLHEGMKANQLSAMLWEQPITASIDTVQGISRLQFDYKKASLNKVKQWLELPILDFFAGAADVTGILSWGGKGATLQVVSDLLGVSTKLPEPLGKTSEEKADFELLLPLSSSEEVELTVHYDEQLDMDLRLKNKEFIAAAIAINGKKETLENGVINITGRLQDADAKQWMGTINDFSFFHRKPERAAEPDLSIRVKQLLIERLNLLGFIFEDALFSAKNQEKNWLLDLKHPELVGRLVVPSAEEKAAQLQIEQINLAHLAEAQAKEGVVDAVLVENEHFPTIQVAIDDLRFNQDSYGQWQFKVEANDGLVKAYEIEALVRSMELTRLSDEQSCELYWQKMGEEYTEINCRFASTRIDRFLREWGMEQGVFSEEFKLDVIGGRWQGNPADFAMDVSYLPISLSLTKGYFADVDSASTNALKALGFFNLSNIVRRLKLDFKDLTQEGLTFDSVKGKVLLDSGIMSDISPVIIKSSASEIKVTGDGDFKHNNLDINMAVSLPLVSNLPWVVALAAGLPAALGVFVISKLLGKQVDKLSTAVYHVSGDMDNPKIKFKHLFDVEKEKKANKKESEVPSGNKKESESRL